MKAGLAWSKRMLCVDVGLIGCKECPLRKNGLGVTCDRLLDEYPEEVERITEQYFKEKRERIKENERNYLFLSATCEGRK